MQQDTLTHVAPVANHMVHTVDSLPTATQQAAVPHARQQSFAKPDTLEPVQQVLVPLHAGDSLTCLPKAFSPEYWDDRLLQVEKTPFLKQLDSLTNTPDQKIVFKPRGVIGDSIPYQFKNDNFATITLLTSFFLVVWVISRSRHFLQGQLKDFFHPRQRTNMFAEHTESELHGQVFLVSQTCFVLGLMFFAYVQENQPEVFLHVSPYRILGTSVGICGIYYLLKWGFYAFINRIFFERQAIEQWNITYQLGVLGLGIALLPLVLLVVYFDLSYTSMVRLFLLTLAVDKTLVFYKCYHTFFKYRLGWVHLFLYFCTLEIAPLFILMRALIDANHLLLTIF